MFKLTAIAAFAAVLSIAAAPAHASLSDNGGGSNGLASNGGGPNGFVDNGGGANGFIDNGGNTNGYVENGGAGNGVAPNGTRPHDAAKTYPRLDAPMRPAIVGVELPAAAR